MGVKRAYTHESSEQHKPSTFNPTATFAAISCGHAMEYMHSHADRTTQPPGMHTDIHTCHWKAFCTRQIAGGSFGSFVVKWVGDVDAWNSVNFIGLVYYSFYLFSDNSLCFFCFFHPCDRAFAMRRGHVVYNNCALYMLLYK